MTREEAYGKFDHPTILFMEQSVPGNGLQVHIGGEALKASRDMIIDYLAISEETYSQNEVLVGAGQTYLHYLDVNWGIVEGASWRPGANVGRIEQFHNYVGDRSPGGIMDFANRFVGWGSLRWKFSEPWVFNPIDNLTVGFVRPVTPALVGMTSNEPMQVCYGGVGRSTGLRRSYETQGIIVPQGAGGAGLWTQEFSDNQRTNNLGADPFFMTDISFVFGNRGVAGAGWNGDIRLLNFIRARVTPSVGDTWSQVPIPLAFYGVDQSPPYRAAFHKPKGGPIILPAGRQIVFDITNNHPGALPCNVQVALIGRIASEVGSLG